MPLPAAAVPLAAGAALRGLVGVAGKVAGAAGKVAGSKTLQGAAMGAHLAGKSKQGGEANVNESKQKFQQKTAEKATEQATTTSPGPLGKSHDVGMAAVWELLKAPLDSDSFEQVLIHPNSADKELSEGDFKADFYHPKTYQKHPMSVRADRGGGVTATIKDPENKYSLGHATFSPVRHPITDKKLLASDDTRIHDEKDRRQGMSAALYDLVDTYQEHIRANTPLTPSEFQSEPGEKFWQGTQGENRPYETEWRRTVGY